MSRSVNAQRLVPVMPPLLKEETVPLARENSSYGGTACENIVKSYFLTHKINIAEPHVDDGVDLLIEKPNEGWVRGQVKKVVYQYKLDHGIKHRMNRDVYRSRFNFNFQGGGEKASASNRTGRRQRKIGEIEYFYHVLCTCYRTLIWETPAELIPLRKDGAFIHGKCPTLDRDSWIRKKADIDWSKMLLNARYDPIIFKSYSDFFLIKKPTLETFFEDEIIER